ncbi:MAG TPA: alpha/beta hydrolase [Longimicrobium sp.]|nr:alpha/beta hydrolase [Longimicrobium sp.]
MTRRSVTVAEPVTRWATVDGGVRLHLLDWGGDGVPVLMLPGAGQSAHIFRTVAPALGPGLRPLAATLRGHGESDTPEAGYTTDRLAADVVAVLDALEIERAALVGHSLGGAIATRVAAAAPERVSHVVYLDSLTDYPGIGRIQARNPARPPVLPAGADDAAQRAWARTCVYGGWNEAAEADWLARAAPEVRAHRHELLAELLDDVAHTPEPYAALRCPALALMAHESVGTQLPWLERGDPRREAASAWLRDVRTPWRRASVERFLREVPHARVAEVHGNHFFFLGAPGRTAAEIRGFLLST